MMKKIISKKLVMCRDTLRALVAMDLVHAIGGADSGQCRGAFDTGDKACEATHLAITIGACG
jgi:hypothetical protein